MLTQKDGLIEKIDDSSIGDAAFADAPIIVDSTIIANDSTAAKKYQKVELKPWHKCDRADEIALSLEIIPEDIPLVPVQNKAPFLTGWNQEPWDKEIIRDYLLNGVQTVAKSGKKYPQFADGIGIPTGNGYLIIDVDGQLGDDYLNEKYPHLNTVSWTSGKPGRRGLLFKLSETQQKQFEGITNVKKLFLNKEGNEQELDFRYEGVQAVIPPSRHPETGRYVWINSFQDVEVQSLPEDLAKDILNLWLQKEYAEDLVKEENPTPTPDAIDTKKIGQEATEEKAGLRLWYYRKVKDANPLDLFSHPDHRWKGNKGFSVLGMFESEPEQSCGIITVRDIPTIKDFGSNRKHTLYDAIRYEWCVFLGKSGYPKGSDWYQTLKSLAARLGWGEIPQSYSKDSYAKIVENEQNYLNSVSIKEGDVHIDIDPIETPDYINEIVKRLPKTFILALNWYMGGGKTELISVLTKLVKKVSSLTPTKALALAQQGRLGVTVREMVGVQGEGSHYNHALLLDELKLALCDPSLNKASDRCGDLFVNDEIDQNQHFLFLGEPCNEKGKRPQNIRAYEKWIQSHDQIIAASAHLDNISLDHIRELRPDLPVIHVTLKVHEKKRVMRLVDSKVVIENYLDQAIKEGKKVCIICDSKDLLKAYETKYRDIKFLSIHRDNVAEKDQQIFLVSPDKYLNESDIQVLGYSPTVGAGVSITHTFDIAFGFNTHLTSTAFIQMIGRPRCQCPLYFWVGHNANYSGNCHSPLSSVQEKFIKNHTDQNILAQLWGEEVQATGDWVEAAIRLKQSSEADRIIKITAKKLAQEAYNLVNRSKTIRALLTKEGYFTVKAIVEPRPIESKGKGKDHKLSEQQKAYDKKIARYQAEGYIIEIEGSEDNFDSTQNEQTKAAKEQNQIVEADAISNARILSDTELTALSEKENLTSEEIANKKRTYLENHVPNVREKLGDSLNEFILEEVVKGRIRNLTAIENWALYQVLERVKVSESKSLNNLLKNWEESNTFTLQDAKYLRSASFKFLKDIEFEKVFDTTGRTEYTAEKLTEIANELTNTKDKLAKFRQHFGLEKLKRNSNASTTNRSGKKWCAVLLEKFNFELQKTKTVKGIEYFKIMPVSILPTAPYENPETQEIDKERYLEDNLVFRKHIEKSRQERLEQQILGKVQTEGQQTPEIKEVATEYKNVTVYEKAYNDLMRNLPSFRGGSIRLTTKHLDIDAITVAKQRLSGNFSCVNESLVKLSEEFIEFFAMNLKWVGVIEFIGGEELSNVLFYSGLIDRNINKLDPDNYTIEEYLQMRKSAKIVNLNQ